MRTFELHDGEDEKKTDELHKFLENVPIIIEWEGENNGINIWLHVPIGSTVEIHDDGAVLVRPVKKETE
jgi:hypothetical protein